MKNASELLPYFSTLSRADVPERDAAGRWVPASTKKETTMPELAHLLDRLRRHADGDGKVSAKICITGPEATALLDAYDRAQAVAATANELIHPEDGVGLADMHPDLAEAVDAWREAMA